MKKVAINEFLVLKWRMIDSLRSQGYPANWIYPTIKSTELHKIAFNLK